MFIEQVFIPSVFTIESCINVISTGHHDKILISVGTHYSSYQYNLILLQCQCQCQCSGSGSPGLGRTPLPDLSLDRTVNDITFPNDDTPLSVLAHRE